MNKDSELSSNISVDDLNKDVQKNNCALTNPFPIEIFSKTIQDYILDAESTLNFNRDYFSASILSAISLAIGNSFSVQIKKDWFEKCNLYIAIIGRSGDGKSHVMREAYFPLQEKQKEYIEDYNDKIKDWNLNPEGNNKPIQKRIFLKDFTLEALTKIHSNNPKGVGVFADELLGWFKNMSRYNSGSDLESYLELWNGGDLISDRVKESTYIKSSFLSILGGIQPKKVNIILKESLESNGFVYRILWVNPKNYTFNKINDLELDPLHKKNYAILINHILDYRNNPKKCVLKLNDKAKDIWLNWWNDTGLKYNGLDNYTREASIKIMTYFNRFLLIMAVLNNASFELMNCATRDLDNLTVTENEISNAILLAEYFMKNAISVKEDTNNPLVDLPKKIKQWYLSLSNPIKTQEAIELGNELDISTSSVEKYLKKPLLFSKTKHGLYEKKI